MVGLKSYSLGCQVVLAEHPGLTVPQKKALLGKEDVEIADILSHAL